MSLRRLDNAVIESSETDSTIVEIGERSVLSGLVLPTMTGTTLTLKVGQTYNDLATVRDKDNNVYTITFTSDTFVIIPLQDAVSWKFVQLVAGSSQAAERTIGLVTSPVL